MPEHIKIAAHINSATEAANVALWSICPDNGETWFSDAWYTLLGYDPGAFEPCFDVFMEMMHPEDRSQTIDAYEKLVSDQTALYMADFRLKHCNGSWVWMGATGSKVTRSGGLPYIIYGMQLDITKRKSTEAALVTAAQSAEEHRQRLARLAENSPAALFEFRMDPDGEITIPYMTSGVHEILAVPREEIQSDGVQVFRNIVEEDMEAIGPAIETSRSDLSPFRIRYRVTRKDIAAGFIWVQASSIPHREQDGSTVWFGSIYDVSEEVSREELIAEARDAMQHLALHDSLTGLPNRRHFDDEMKSRLGVSKGQTPTAVIIRIDLDRFKYVNDSLGHAAGDLVLVRVARILNECLPHDGVAFRMGGDEFCVLMPPHANVEEAVTCVTNMQAMLSKPLLYEGRPCRFGASFGIASSDQGQISNGDLMSFADAALYEAKAAGRGRLIVFDNKLHQSILEGRRLASEIETAIENREFEPFFQPQVDAKTGVLTGVEVLARWRTRDGRILGPDQFISIAEQVRAVPLIDQLMVEQCVEIFDTWRDEMPTVPKVAFNVSAGRLRDNSLVAAVSPLQEQGIVVAFELLESIFLEDDDAVVSFNLDSARESGICIEIDDFGTGHASILGLMKVNPDVLKIDRRLTANVVDAEQSRTLIASIINIARSLDVQTIAEGVETEEQSRILCDLGCDVLQGFLYAKPLDSEKLLEWLRARQDGKRTQIG